MQISCEVVFGRFLKPRTRLIYKKRSGMIHIDGEWENKKLKRVRLLATTKNASSLLSATVLPAIKRRHTFEFKLWLEKPNRERGFICAEKGADWAKRTPCRLLGDHEKLIAEIESFFAKKVCGHVVSVAGYTSGIVISPCKHSGGKSRVAPSKQIRPIQKLIKSLTSMLSPRSK